MKTKKIIKVILIYLIIVLCGIWLNNVIQDKDLYNSILDIFTREDYRAVNFVFLTYQCSLGYCVYKLVVSLIKKVKGKKVIKNG